MKSYEAKGAFGKVVLVENEGDYFLNGEKAPLLSKLDMAKYGTGALEVALLGRVGEIEPVMELIGQVRHERGEDKKLEISGLRFIEGSQLKVRKEKYKHYRLDMVDDSGSRHLMEVIEFGEDICGVAIDSRIIATDGIVPEVKRFTDYVRELSR